MMFNWKEDSAPGSFTLGPSSTSHTYTAIVLCIGILLGFGGVALHQAVGVGLFFMPVGWLLGRYTLALFAKSRIKRTAARHNLLWVVPEIVDGSLVWEKAVVIDGTRVVFKNLENSWNIIVCPEDVLITVINRNISGGDDHV